MNNISILNLPNEILVDIISYLDWESIQNLKMTNKKFNLLCDNSYIHENTMKMEYGKWILNPKLMSGCINYNINIYDLKIENQIDTLCRYIYTNQWDIVKFLIRYIIQKQVRNKNQDTLAIILFKIGIWYLEGRKIIEYILKHNIINLDLKLSNIHGRTVLTYVCLNCDVDMLKSILNYSSFTKDDIMKRDIYGWNAIMYAIVYNRTEMIEYLNEQYSIFLSKNDLLEISVHVKSRNIVQGRWNFNDTLRRIAEIDDFEEDEIPTDYSQFYRSESHSNTSDYTSTSLQNNRIQSNDISDKLINDNDIINRNIKIVMNKYKKNNIEYVKYISMEHNLEQWLEDIFSIYKNSTFLEEKKHIIMKMYNTVINLPNILPNEEVHLRNMELVFEINRCIIEINTQIRHSENDKTWRTFIKSNNIDIGSFS